MLTAIFSNRFVNYKTASRLHMGTYLLKLIPCRKSNWLHVGSIPAVPTLGNNPALLAQAVRATDS